MKPQQFYLLSVARLSKTNRREVIVEECIRLLDLMRRILHHAPTRCSAAAARSSDVSHRQFVCTFGAGVSPPAMNLSRGRWAGFYGMLFTP